MQDLKPYLLPGLALGLLILWFFLIQPRLESRAETEAGANSSETSRPSP